jgi:hypothetical protein
MAGKIPSFLTGANLVIKIGDVQIAFAQSLSFQRNVAHTAVMGIGAYDVLALEPTSFAASGSMQILRWTDELFNLIAGIDKTALPDNMQSTTNKANMVGNSIVDKEAFDPRRLLLSKTFDIDVYEKRYKDDDKDATAMEEGKLVFVLRDCRINNYNFNFVPGEILVENISFLCRRIEDGSADVITA